MQQVPMDVVGPYIILGLYRIGSGFRAVYRVPLYHIWEFPKSRRTLFGCPYNMDPTIQGTTLGPPIFGNSHVGL